MSVSDATFSEVIGRHFHCDAITGENSNSVAAELAREVSQYRSILIQLYAEQPGGEFFNHGPGHFNAIFFTHLPPTFGLRSVENAPGRAKIRYRQVYRKKYGRPAVAEHPRLRPFLESERDRTS